MEPSPTARPLTDRPARAGAVALAAGVALTLGGAVRADDPALQLQGLFCNREEQVDGTLAHISRGLAPRAAVEITNRLEIVCTYVDLLHYVVDHPVDIGKTDSVLPLVKYRAMLVGVLVGDNLRPVSPPVEVFFVTPERIAGAAIERRT